MIILSAFCRCRAYRHLVLAVSVCIIPACITPPPEQTDVPAGVGARHEKYKKLERENKRLKKGLAKSNADRKGLEDRIAKTQLQLLEKDAQIEELKKRLISQQEIMDEAILEVVRAKAKLRTLESKAEAASNMAEAEIAVKALKVQLASREDDPEVIKAEELLKMSALEFKKENYGGALYLISQAKSHIKSRRGRLGGEKEIASFKGEVLFARPVPLQVLKKSNLRRRPDHKSKILTTLEKGTSVFGYSYRGEWVRVKREDGIDGWIFQTLVGGR